MPAYLARHAASSEPRYHGRHRAPSSSTRALTLGGVGVTAIAVSVIAPTAAHAATAAQWDRVAACESGGHWTDNTGNGYYGGLQFSVSTWDGFGGTAYAPIASEASPGEQMTIADRVLAAQGWGAWPVCSREAGVAGTSTTGAAAVAAPEAVKAAVGISLPRDPHAGDRPHARANGHLHTDYQVQPGDSLIGIARSHHEAGGWRHLWAANRSRIGSNPSQLRIGERIWVQHIKRHDKTAHQHSARSGS